MATTNNRQPPKPATVEEQERREAARKKADEALKGANEAQRERNAKRASWASTKARKRSGEAPDLRSGQDQAWASEDKQKDAIEEVAQGCAPDCQEDHEHDRLSVPVADMTAAIRDVGRSVERSGRASELRALWESKGKKW